MQELKRHASTQVHAVGSIHFSPLLCGTGGTSNIAVASITITSLLPSTRHARPALSR